MNGDRNTLVQDFEEQAGGNKYDVYSKFKNRYVRLIFSYFEESHGNLPYEIERFLLYPFSILSSEGSAVKKQTAKTN